VVATPSPSKKRASKKSSGKKPAKKSKTAAKADKKPKAKGKSKGSKKSGKTPSKTETKLSTKKKAKSVGMTEKAAAVKDKLAKKFAKKKQAMKEEKAEAAKRKAAAAAKKVAAKKPKKATKKSTPTKIKPVKKHKAAKSPLKSGSFKVASKTAVMPQLNPKGNLVHKYDTLCGVQAYQFVKSSKPEPAYMAAFFQAVDNNPTVQARLGSIGTFDVKTAPTINEPKTFLTINKITKEEREYNECQLLTVTGTNASKEDIAANWKAVTVEANRHTSTISGDNKYSTATHQGECSGCDCFG